MPGRKARNRKLVTPSPTTHVTEMGMVIVQCVGDIALNGGYCEPQKQKSLSECLAQLAADLGPCDLRVGNWESPLWGDGGVNVLKSPRLCTTRDAAESILPFGLDVALLANNHAYDCLEKGFENTVRFFDENGIRWLGAGRSPEEASRPLILERGGCRLALLNCVALDTHPSIPPNAGVYVNVFDEARVLADVGAMKEQVDHVLLFLHWGRDWTSYPTLAQRRFARNAIEAGVTLVVGHHAHFLQGHEAWRNGYVFYGLGNFLFDRIAPDHPLPDAASLTAVATCDLRANGVVTGALTSLRLRSLLLEPDNRRIRSRTEARLNSALSLPDERYASVLRREQIRYRLMIVRYRLERDGLLVGTWRICRQYVGRILDIAVGRLRRRGRLAGGPAQPGQSGVAGSRQAPRGDTCR